MLELMKKKKHRSMNENEIHTTYVRMRFYFNRVTTAHPSF